jgi:hypothetical protein
MTTAEEQDLPWWTAEEMQAVDELIRSARDYDLPLDVTPWQLPVRRLLEQQGRDNAKWISYKPQVLEKYIFNRYCDVGYDDETKSHYIRFLNTDSSKLVPVILILILKMYSWCK